MTSMPRTEKGKTLNVRGLHCICMELDTVISTVAALFCTSLDIRSFVQHSGCAFDPLHSSSLVLSLRVYFRSVEAKLGIDALPAL